MSPDLDAIRARADAATPGPWEADDWEIYDESRNWIAETCDPDDAPSSIADAAFIAHARTDVPALLAALAAVEQDRDRLSAELARVEPVLQAAQAWRRWFPHASSMFVPENALIAAVDAHRLSECIDETADDIDEDLRTEAFKDAPIAAGAPIIPPSYPKATMGGF